MTEAELRAYLLGRASEEAAVQLEERLLGDESVFDALRCAEDDLFDDFVRDRLTPEDRTYFLQRYQADTNRLAFARALARRTTLSAWRGSWWTLAAAATLVIVAGGLMRTRDTPTAVVPLAQLGDMPAVVSTPPVVAILVLGATRSETAVAAVDVPVGAPRLELRLRLNPADRFEQYAVDLRSAGDAVVWRAGDLRATADGRELLLVAPVPAAVLVSGSYELSVHGLTANTAPEPLGFLMVQINRTP